MSALAAMFAPPRIRHGHTRLIIAGREVKSRHDLPPMPDAAARQEATQLIKRAKERQRDEKRAEIRRAQKKAWREANKEKMRAYVEKWKQENPERKAELQKASYMRLRLRPGYKEKANAASLEFYYRKKSDPEYMANRREVDKLGKQRRRNENRAASTNETSNGHTAAAQGEKRNGANRATAHAKRVQTTSNLQSRMAAPHV